jgi:hypothetical protein
MLWFNHPRPVGSRKPVAVLVQRQTAHRNTLILQTPHHDLPCLHKDFGLAAPPLEFSVRYALPEYVSFMWEHARHLIRRRRIGWFPSWYMLVKSTWAAAFHFVLQGRSRHTYKFSIDRHGIMRTGPGGVTLIGWDDVIAIRSYTRGRMLVLRRGTLPIPARCLSAEQADSLAGYAARVRAAAPQ